MKLFYSKFLMIMSVVFLVSCLIMTPQTVKATVTVIVPSSADNYIDQLTPNAVGASGLAAGFFGGSGNRRHGLVKFDLSAVPVGAIINSATLRLTWFSYDGNPFGKTLIAYRVTQDWIESQVTWNNAKTGSPWGAPGGVWAPEHSVSATVNPPMNLVVTWTVTDIVKDWISEGRDNFGFILVPGTMTEPDGVYFLSRENGQGDVRPTLTIDWDPPPFDFSVNAESRLTITQGFSGSNTITVNLVSGLTEPVSLSVSGLPPGASASFNPQSGNPPFTSILTITASTSTPTGSFMITVTGTGSQTHTTTFTLTVNPAARPVGGVTMPTNKLEILTPYLALAGLAVAVSAVVAVKKRRD